jgi:hypothetical protein
VAIHVANAIKENEEILGCGVGIAPKHFMRHMNGLPETDTVYSSRLHLTDSESIPG